MVRQMVSELVWSEGADAYFAEGAGTERITVEAERLCSHMDGMTREQLQDIHADAEMAIWDANIERLGALKRLALLNDGEITGQQMTATRASRKINFRTAPTWTT